MQIAAVYKETGTQESQYTAMAKWTSAPKKHKMQTRIEKHGETCTHMLYK